MNFSNYLRTFSRIKAVETVKMISREEREKVIKEADTTHFLSTPKGCVHRFADRQWH